MMPRLEDQERIFVNKFFYRFGEIERGDIVVFHFPLDPSKSYVKRIVGLPGDEVEMREGVLHPP
jgi:signal peptidase I